MNFFLRMLCKLGVHDWKFVSAVEYSKNGLKMYKTVEFHRCKFCNETREMTY